MNRKTIARYVRMGHFELVISIRRVFFCYKVGRSCKSKLVRVNSEAWNKANSGVINSDKSFDRWQEQL